MFHGKRVGVVIPAAGKGTRFRSPSDVSKQFLELGGLPVFLHSLMLFDSLGEIDAIVLVGEAGQEPVLRGVLSRSAIGKVSAIAVGGAERQDSVRSGLAALEPSRPDLVLVHDAVRPFVDERMVSGLLAAAEESGAAVLAVRPKDTLGISRGGDAVDDILKREELWMIQTPECFRYDLLSASIRRAGEEGFIGTDESGIVRRYNPGIRIRIVEGSYDNIKITTPDDLEAARTILRRRSGSQ